MRSETKALKEAAIAQAAYELIEAKGYSGTSMLAIAKAARASNETLYNWYGDKLGLFTALIARNAQDVRAHFGDDLAAGAEPLDSLAVLGPKLLGLLVSPRAIALNRAAAGDATGELGAALARTGRDTILPMVAALFERARDQGELHFDRMEDALDLYLSLLVGDLQIRRAIGVLPPMSEAEVNSRAERALGHFMTHFGTP